jgi:hypothetical protein
MQRNRGSSSSNVQLNNIFVYLFNENIPVEIASPSQKKVLSGLSQRFQFARSMAYFVHANIFNFLINANLFFYFNFKLFKILLQTGLVNHFISDLHQRRWFIQATKPRQGKNH